MATMQQRFEKTKEFILDEDVTLLEGLVHVYLWYRFEHAIIQRNKHHERAKKYAKELNINLDVISFRKQMKDA